jgi:hypothetical protein
MFKVAAMFETLVGVGATAFVGWVAAGLVWAFHTNARLDVVESKQAAFETWLGRVENKLDRVIEHRK